MYSAMWRKRVETKALVIVLASYAAVVLYLMYEVSK
jgi:hypothetical protein